MKGRIFVPGITLLLLFVSTQAPAQRIRPVLIVFDTDIGPDYDDVGALTMLHAFADNGECTILATIASNQHRYAAAALSVLNTYFNRPDLPIGVIKGQALNMSAPQKWDSMITADYPHRIKTNDEAWDAVKLYRRLLSLQPDSSVTIITVGFLTNMSNLLQSPADEYSSLSGAALVGKKVRVLVSMAGRFGAEAQGFKEFNVMKDLVASQNTFENWPTPIVFSGFEIGVHIFTGLPIANSALLHSPVKDVFQRSIPMDPHDKAGRMSWDETAVLVAVRGTEKYFDIVKGKAICYGDGSTGWDPNGQRDGYLVQKLPPEEIAGVINALIMHQPVKTR